ncbi:glycosyltransferase 87 family protein [Dactylosporangium sp. NPDC051541]|uniref:glycosyltransferase 87 family protein n=1 Tax=Dactylosporangium sp. NPDC051541 TaxID=3363977 RepID=UPI0037966A00
MLCAAFAAVTALTSTLLPHRAWGAIAWIGYTAGAALVLVLSRRLVVWLVFAATALLPLLVESIQRASGRTDRAQEEVLVVEHMGDRLVHTGTPYLSRAAIADLPADDRLLGYAPYQPGMSVFGLPRAAFGSSWWTDARVWFAIVTLFCLVYSLKLLLADAHRLTQAVAALPLCTLTLATGGDDIPVLALCVLALALASRDRFIAAGVAVGLAGALKLFALPVALVLLVLAWPPLSRAARFAVFAFGIPLVALVPALVVHPDAFMENAIRFPTGQGLVTSPAQSPLPGHLIASSLPAGRTIALALLLLAGAVIAYLLYRHRPTTSAAAAAFIAAGLTAAIMLTPTTRFGYLLYPATFLAYWWDQRRSDSHVNEPRQV